jgi:hypothetical protein
MRYYVHHKFKDVFIEVCKIQYTGPTYRKMKVRWWNIGFTGNPWCLDSRPQIIKIENKKWNQDWSWFDPLTDVHPGRRK